MCQAVGMLYLHEVLKPIINRIFEERKYIELDPCKIDLNRSRCVFIIQHMHNSSSVNNISLGETAIIGEELLRERSVAREQQ